MKISFETKIETELNLNFESNETAVFAIIIFNQIYLLKVLKERKWRSTHCYKRI